MSVSTKSMQTFGYCSACYYAFPALQAAFPGKPLYEPHTTVSLPPHTKERELARCVLAELNPSWENQFSHTFTEALTTVLPEYKLTQRKGQTERKREQRAKKIKIVSEINDHF